MGLAATMTMDMAPVVTMIMDMALGLEMMAPSCLGLDMALDMVPKTSISHWHVDADITY